jgi:ACR3 family arsenite transporter
MAGGLLLGRLVPGLQVVLAAVQVDHISLPIALGLLLMMYPVLAKVRYGELGHVARDRRLLKLALALALGDREAAALLVAINSSLQVLPAWLGLDSQVVKFSFWEITRAVLIFLGIPLVAGFLARTIGVRTKGFRW